jgi:hypothetical protein
MSPTHGPAAPSTLFLPRSEDPSTLLLPPFFRLHILSLSNRSAVALAAVEGQGGGDMVPECADLVAQMLLHLMACVHDGKLVQAATQHAPPHDADPHNSALVEQCLLISLQTLCNSSVNSRSMQQCV